MGPGQRLLHTAIGEARLTLDGAFALRFEGRMTEADPEARLSRCLQDVHARVIGAGLRELTVDVTRLAWASEAVVSAIVGWILEVQQSRPEQVYAVRFLIDANSAWQAATFRALRSVASNIVELDYGSPASGRGS